jgi:hypothetical protein
MAGSWGGDEFPQVYSIMLVGQAPQNAVSLPCLGRLTAGSTIPGVEGIQRRAIIYGTAVAVGAEGSVRQTYLEYRVQVWAVEFFGEQGFGRAPPKKYPAFSAALRDVFIYGAAKQ